MINLKNMTLFSFLILASSFEASAKEKEFTLKSHIQSIILQKDNRYKVQLISYASNYYADKKFYSCLEKALKNKKAVTIKATAKKNEITECK